MNKFAQLALAAGASLLFYSLSNIALFISTQTSPPEWLQEHMAPQSWATLAWRIVELGPVFMVAVLVNLLVFRLAREKLMNVALGSAFFTTLWLFYLFGSFSTFLGAFSVFMIAVMPLAAWLVLAYKRKFPPNNPATPLHNKS